MIWVHSEPSRAHSRCFRAFPVEGTGSSEGAELYWGHRAPRAAQVQKGPPTQVSSRAFNLETTAPPSPAMGSPKLKDSTGARGEQASGG